ncbi:hypothetical protein ABDK56_02085 [Sphingomonas sp. ASV193]|uniref:hypothetical protein n=1 Tax=Sphingomonas sp. ASV193 TaxID=3144405 RepID=UPI0032E90484
MASVYRPVHAYEATPTRRRLSGMALAILVNLAVLLLLIGLRTVVPMASVGKPNGTITTLDLGRDEQPAADKAAPQKAQRRVTPPVVPPPPVASPSKVAAPKSPPTTLLKMSASDMAAADISNLGSNKPGGGPGDSDAVGTGPNGETLYAADWLRRPTDAELGGYLPANAADGFGEVACKTYPGFRVDDCQEIGETPGSRLARAVRQAAWQFKVKPPKKNGQFMVGSWVLIRIDYSGRRRDD